MSPIPKKTSLFLCIPAITLIFFLSFELTKLSAHKDGFIHFLDVQNGDATLIVTPQRQKILIDGGDHGNIMEELPKHLSFFDKSIDMIILTHPADEHIHGLIEVLHRYDVKHIFWTGINSKHPSYKEFLGIARKKRVHFHLISGDKDIKLSENIYLEILSPLSSLAGKLVSPDSSAIMKLIVSGKPLALFGGDIRKQMEKKILQSELDLHAEILRLSDHGSHESNTEEFIHAVNPKTVIISVADEEKSDGFPHLELLERLEGKKVRMTKNEGTISIRFDVFDGEQ